MRPSRSSETRSGRFLAVIAFAGLAFLAPREAFAEACVWTGTTNTNWDTVTNWNTCGGTFPSAANDTAAISTGTPNDNPVIASGDTILCGGMTLNAGVTVTVSGTLTLTGTTTGAGNLTVSGTGVLNWNSGTMSGAGTTTIQASGDLNFQTSSTTLQRPLVNQGTVTATGTAYVNIGVGGSINNSGLWDIRNDQGIFGSGQVVTNTGTLRRSTSAGEATIQPQLNGSGAVQVQSGTLQLTGGGTYSGDFIFTGTTLRFNGSPTWALTGDFSGGSGGTLLLDSGTQNFNAGATLTSVGLLNVAGSTANFSTSGTVTPSNLTLSSGTLTGPNALTLAAAGTMIWSGGTMSGTGTTTIGAGRNLNLTGSAATLQRALVNQGTATTSGNGYLNIGVGGSLNNSGLWEIQNDQGIFGSGQIVTNTGTIRRSTSAGDATIQPQLNGSGAVQVQSGTLVLNGGGTYSGDFVFTGATLRFNGSPTWALTGDFSGGSGGTLLLDSGTQNFNAGATFTTVGLLNVAGSTGNFNTSAAVVPSNLTISSGTFAGANAVQLASGGTLTWSGGAMSGTGTTTIGTGRTLVVNGFGVTLSRPLVNQGSATQSGSGSVSVTAGGSITNSGNWELQGDAGISGFSQVVNNTGTIRRTTSSGEVIIGTNVSNSGTINVETGTLALTGTLTQTAGGLHLIGGNLRNIQNLLIQGGVLDGTANINGTVAASGSGQVSPGTSPGQLTITNNRNYTQTSPAVLNIDVDGLTPGTEYDRIAIAGAATLGGELAVSIGYTPAVGDSFTILTHASRTGTFGTLTLPSPGPGLGWDLSYSATETKLTIAEMLAALLAVDSRVAAGTSSDANGVLEPGERVVVEPAWRNVSDSPIAFTGTASNFTGPAGETYTLNDSSASYGTTGGNATTDCFAATANCYQVQVSDTTTRPEARPSVHWDSTFREAVTGGQNKTWTLHIGDSFADAPRSHLFYRRIETLLHTGITAGCTTTNFCPDDTVNRGQMAIFVARALAGGSANVPVSGEVAGQGYNCIAGASGASIFTDVLPTDIFCRHVHYIATRNVTLGCSATTYCPTGTITRIEMAAFIAKAIVAPGGGLAVPTTYTDPVTGFSYNCNSFNGSHFTDVPFNNVFCKHVNFLWAKAIVTGTSPTTYGPAQAVTRGAMARFLSNAFNLLLYGPVP
jgi:hypothetical protein